MRKKSSPEKQEEKNTQAAKTEYAYDADGLLGKFCTATSKRVQEIINNYPTGTRIRFKPKAHLKPQTGEVKGYVPNGTLLVDSDTDIGRTTGRPVRYKVHTKMVIEILLGSKQSKKVKKN